MGKTKRQLRAEAAERLRHLWNTCIKDTRQLFGALVDKGAPIYAERSDFDALIDLLEDDELPEGDAIFTLREYGRQCDSSWERKRIDEIADMVERDYVKREKHDEALEIRDKALGDAATFKVERDKAQTNCHVLNAQVGELRTVERGLRAERDELKKRVDEQQKTLDIDCRDLIEYDKALDAVKNERDEWKAKAEAKSAKRAAAAERVRKAKDAGTSIGYAIVGREYYPWEAYDTLIDLLSDEPMDAQRDSNGTCPDAMRQSPIHSIAQSKTGPNLTEQSESLSDESCRQYADRENLGSNLGTSEYFEGKGSEVDSREKLEAELPCYFGEPRDLAMIRGWLDRQAAIATRECTSVYEQGCESCRAAQKRRIAELQTQVDELTARLTAACDSNDDYRSEWHRVCAERMDLRRELTASKNEGVRLAEELGKTMAERDQWRDKCGEMLDAAQEIRRLADIE